MFRRQLDLIVGNSKLSAKLAASRNLFVTSWTSRQQKEQQAPCSSLSTTGPDRKFDAWCHSVAPDSAMGAFARVVLMADWMRDMSCLCLKCCVTSFPKEYTSTWRAASGSMPLALQADEVRLLHNTTYNSRLCFSCCCAEGDQTVLFDERKCRHSTKPMQTVEGVTGSK